MGLDIDVYSEIKLEPDVVWHAHIDRSKYMRINFDNSKVYSFKEHRYIRFSHGRFDPWLWFIDMAINANSDLYDRLRDDAVNSALDKWSNSALGGCVLDANESKIIFDILVSIQPQVEQVAIPAIERDDPEFLTYFKTRYQDMMVAFMFASDNGVYASFG